MAKHIRSSTAASKLDVRKATPAIYVMVLKIVIMKPFGILKVLMYINRGNDN